MDILERLFELWTRVSDVDSVTLRDAEDEIKKLRAALRIYSLPSNWRVDGTFLAPSPQSEYRPDCGDTARAALGETE